MQVVLPEPVAENITQFSGRSWLLRRVAEWNEAGANRLLMIVGKPGTGKSMIAAWLAGHGPLPAGAEDGERLQQLRKQVKGVHFCQVDSLNNSPREMARLMARQLTETVTGFGEALLSEPTISSRIEIGRVEA